MTRANVAPIRAVHVECRSGRFMLIGPVQAGFLIECETPVSVLERLLKYPEWDSNPQQAGFEPTASASWAIGATRIRRVRSI